MTAKPVTEAEKNALRGLPFNPHPDGKPWDKCCGTKQDEQCMCLIRKPKNGLSRYDRIFTEWAFAVVGVKQSLAILQQEQGRFFCVHRLDEGFNRECAGWAKLKGEKS